MSRLILLSTLILISTTSGRASACTSAVVARPASSNGRALLWKHRDSKNQHNEVVLRDDGKYRYVGVVNAGDEAAREIWMGVNEAGLAVMNTASDDLEKPDLPRDGEGRLLKVLLQSCASIEDVEKLLALTNAGGRDVTTNIGIIDANGGAAFFEVGQESYEKYDANEQKSCKRGYIIRTNHALSAPPDEGGGYIRMARAENLFAEEWKRGRGLGAQFILAGPSLDLANEATGIFPRKERRVFIDARDTINRTYSVSDAVFEGIAEGEPPLATVMWVALGQPIAAIAVPVWPVLQDLSPALNGEKQALLEELSDTIRKKLYPRQRGNLKHYMNAEKALTVRRSLDATQQRIFSFVETQRAKSLSPDQLAAMTTKTTEMAETALRRVIEELEE